MILAYTNVMVKMLTLLPRVREVLGLIIVPETGYTDSFSWFSSLHPGKFRDITLK
jgi:hypothetical protein